MSDEKLPPDHSTVACPRCKAAPFDQFLPGQIVRFDWFGLRKRIFAVICRACKNIVGYES